MPKLKVWDKNKRAMVAERELAESEILSIERRKLKDRTNRFVDGCTIRLKDDQGGPGEKLLSDENYSEVCRRFGVRAKGASDHPEGVRTFPSASVPAASVE